MSERGPIVVIGFKGSGKSVVGKIAARKLSFDFIDTDSVIERLYQKREGVNLSFREIYDKHGAEYFRKLENEAAKEALVNKNSVVSIGGGTLVNSELEKADFGDAVFVYLTVDKKILFERIFKNGIPAFLDEDDPKGSLEKLLAERSPVYEKFADFTVDNTVKTPEAAADEIADWIKKVI